MLLKSPDQRLQGVLKILLPLAESSSLDSLLEEASTAMPRSDLAHLLALQAAGEAGRWCQRRVSHGRLSRLCSLR